MTGEGGVRAVGLKARPEGKTETWLDSPYIDLTGETGSVVTLSFWHWMDASRLLGNRPSGGGVVFIGNAAGWTMVEPYGGYDGKIEARRAEIHGQPGFTDEKVERVWRKSFFDFTAFAGQKLKIRWHYATNTITPGEGWFLDDVRIIRGGVIKHKVDTDLSVCKAGSIVRFNFLACDEGWASGGRMNSWVCGPATPLEEFWRAPEGDGPAFDTDSTGLLFATAPSGYNNPGEVSYLVSPEINISGCEGRKTSLSFWHWYHFSPGGGGFVEVFNGYDWVQIEPASGYNGKIINARPSLGYLPDGFVTKEDKSNGWRFEAFDISDYIDAHFRIRLRFFGGVITRPGWYIDTVTVSTSILEDIPRFDGDPQLPDCGFDSEKYIMPEFDEVLPDPCIMGTPIVEGETVYLAEGGAVAPDWEFSDERYIPVDIPQSGSICIVISNGGHRKDSRVESGEVFADSVKIAGDDKFNKDHTLLRGRSAVEAGTVNIKLISRSSVPGTRYAYSIMFQPGNSMPNWLDGGDGTHPGAPSNTSADYMNFSFVRADQAGYFGKFQVEGSLPAYDAETGGFLLRTVVQMSDPVTCRQVAEIRNLQPIYTATKDGWESSFSSPGFAWDGMIDGTQQPYLDNRIYVRVFAVAEVPGVPIRPEVDPLLPEDGPPFPRPQIETPNILPDIARFSARWIDFFTRLVTPHVEELRTIDGTDRVAPSALYLSDPDGYFNADRYAYLTGGFAWNPAWGEPQSHPEGGYYLWRVYIEQDGNTWTTYPASMESLASWMLQVWMPKVGEVSPPQVHKGPAHAVVFPNPVHEPPPWDPPPALPGIAEFSFRAPMFDDIKKRDGDGFVSFIEAAPGDTIKIIGKLLRTYDVKFKLTRGTTTLKRYNNWSEIDFVEPIEITEADDTTYTVSLPPDLPPSLSPFDTCIETDTWLGDNDPEGIPRCFNVRLPVAATGISPSYGRVDTRICVEGERLDLIADKSPKIILRGPLSAEIEAEYDAGDICGIIPEALQNFTGSYQVSVIYLIDSIRKYVPCEGAACPLTFVLTGRQGGLFSQILLGDLIRVSGTTQTCRDREGNDVVLSIQTCGDDCPFTITRNSSNLTPSSPYNRFDPGPGNIGGVRLDEECTALAMLNWTGPDPGDFEWAVFYAGFGFEHDYSLVNREPFNPWIGTTASWDHLVILTSPDGTVGILGIPYETAGSDVAIQYWILDLFNDATVGSYHTWVIVEDPYEYVTSYAAMLHTNAVNYFRATTSTGRVVPINTHYPVSINPPDPNEP